MSIMFGNGRVNTDPVNILKTIQFIAKDDGVAGVIEEWTDANGNKHPIASPTYYDEMGALVEATNIEVGKTYFVKFSFAAKDPGTIIVGASNFPGTYYVIGDTFARSETTGRDEYYQFQIPRAKMLAENTITLEAAGDPSVFNMNLSVLRPADGQMMKLVKFGVEEYVDPAPLP